MNALTAGQLKMEERFNALVVKEALGTITQQEHARLERHQRLRRSYLGFARDSAFEARRDWEFQKQMKTLSRLRRRFEE